ncbi:MAG: GTP cyclohydrolase I [Gaiellaceae bacterium]
MDYGAIDGSTNGRADDPSTGWATAKPRIIAANDWHRFRDNIAEILTALGLDLDTPGARETPERYLQALLDATAGYDGDPKLLAAFPAEHDGDSHSRHSQVIEGPIVFHALCEHHALPFFGAAHIGYVADEQIIGISKLTRLVRLYARRFTVQERLGEQIADALVDLVAPHGVAVHLDAEHLCTAMRGVEANSSTVTSVWRGVYEDSDLRREFLDEVHSLSARGRQ